MDQPVETALTQANMHEILNQSVEQAVVMLFWAEQIPESADQRRQLANIMAAYDGKALLATVDVASQPEIAQSMKIRQVPAIRLVSQGKVVGQVDGIQPEAALRTMLDQLTMSGGEYIKAELQALLAEDDLDGALQLVQQALQEEPTDVVLQAEQADLLVRTGQLDAAKQVLEQISQEADVRKRPAERLAFIEEAQQLATPEAVADRLKADPKDLATHYMAAVHDFATEAFESGFEHLLIIVQQDRHYQEELGRKTMIRAFSLLEQGHPLLSVWRRRLFNSLH